MCTQSICSHRIGPYVLCVTACVFDLEMQRTRSLLQTSRTEIEPKLCLNATMISLCLLDAIALIYMVSEPDLSVRSVQSDKCWSRCKITQGQSECRNQNRWWLEQIGWHCCDVKCRLSIGEAIGPHSFAHVSCYIERRWRVSHRTQVQTVARRLLSDKINESELCVNSHVKLVRIRKVKPCNRLYTVFIGMWNVTQPEISTRTVRPTTIVRQKRNAIAQNKHFHCFALLLLMRRRSALDTWWMPRLAKPNTHAP